MSEYNFPGKSQKDPEGYWDDLGEEEAREEGENIIKKEHEEEVDQKEKVKYRSGYLEELDWAIGNYEYLVTVCGESEDWYIEEIEKYKLNSNKLDVVTGEEFEEIEKQLNNDNDFIDTVERLYAEHSANMAEFYRDQEIDRKIEESWFRKRGIKI